MAEWLSRDEARRLCDGALALSKSDGCQVTLQSGASGNTRYAGNEISTAGDAADAALTMSSRFGHDQRAR